MNEIQEPITYNSYYPLCEHGQIIEYQNCHVCFPQHANFDFNQIEPDQTCEHGEYVKYKNCIRCFPWSQEKIEKEIMRREAAERKKNAKQNKTKPPQQDYFPYSRSSCKAFDLLEQELHVQIDHAHFLTIDEKQHLPDILYCYGDVVRDSEHPVFNEPWNPYKVDGFYYNIQDQKVAIEFLVTFIMDILSLIPTNINLKNHNLD